MGGIIIPGSDRFLINIITLISDLKSCQHFEKTQVLSYETLKKKKDYHLKFFCVFSCKRKHLLKSSSMKSSHVS